MAFRDAPGPPGEQRGGADARGLALQGGAAGKLRLVEGVQVSEVGVEERIIGQRPQVLGPLQLRGIVGQEQEMDVVRHAQPQRGMPARLVEHEHDLLPGAGADRLGEGAELGLKDRDGGGRGQVPEGTARGRVHKADQIAPAKAVLHDGTGPLANRGPDPAEERLEADPVLVQRPGLDLRLGEGGRDRP
jgi:hypothetical protein